MDPLSELNLNFGLHLPDFHRPLCYIEDVLHSKHSQPRPSSSRDGDLQSPSFSDHELIELELAECKSSHKSFLLHPQTGHSCSIKQIFNLLDPVPEVTNDYALRHLFWIMHGLPTSLFPSNKTQKTVNVSLEQLTRSCSADVLNQCLELGSMIKTLLNFILVHKNDSNLDHTMYAYVQSLYDYLLYGPFRTMHRLTQCNWCQTEDQFTVLGFLQFMNDSDSGHLKRNLMTVFGLHQQIESQMYNADRCTSTILTINCLYDALSVTGIVTQDHQKHLWEMFLSCICPCLQYLQDFFISGQFNDPHGEFFFEKNQVPITENYWDQCLKVRCPDNIPSLLTAQWKFILIGIRSRLLIARFDTNFHVQSLPKQKLFDIFLQELLILLRQSLKHHHHHRKSVTSIINEEEQANLDKRETIFKGDIQANQTCRLLDDLNKCFTLPELVWNFEQEDGIHLIKPPSKAFITQQDECRLLHDCSYETSLPSEPKFEGYLPESNYEQSRSSKSNQWIQTMPLHYVLQKAMDKALAGFVQPICNQILSLFKQKFFQHVQVMNCYYLMQLQGHQLSLFFDRLFTDLIDNPQRCGGRLPTNFHSLHSADSVQRDSQNVIAYFSFTHASNDSNIYLNILSAFFLLYKDLDPITETILNASATQFYHDCFQMMLRFRFTIWVSENLHVNHRSFQTVARPRVSTPGYQCYHLLSLVRHRILFTLNNLYTSMMQRIEECVDKLKQNVAQAQDYEQMRNCFGHFQHEIRHCLWMEKDTKSILMTNLLATLSSHVFRMKDLWQQLMKQFDLATDSQQPKQQSDPFDYQVVLQELQQMYDFLVNNSKIYRLFENV